MRGRGSAVVWSWALGALAVLLGLASGATTALAGWSVPRALSRSTTGFRHVELATDARGDVAVAWATESEAGRRTPATVKVVLVGAGGRLVQRTLWRSGDALLGDVAVALDARGELTVVWIAAARGRSGATLAPHTIRAVYRTPSGRWSATQVVGSSGPFLAADLRLAVAPSREVLLTWRAHNRIAPGVAAAWRKPGHRFGPASAVGRAKGSMMIDPTPLFDSGGAAHVYGTVSCGRAILTCVTMVSTAPHGRRFGAPRLIAPAPAELPVVSFSAPGRALIVWEAGDYEDLEPSFAAPRARVMSGGSLSAPVALRPNASSVSIQSPVNAVAANGGGGTVSWSETPAPFPSPARTMLAVGDASGRFAAPSVSPLGLMPMLRDGAGDALLRLGRVGGPAGVPPSPAAMQPVGGGAAQPSPMPAAPSASFAGAATVQPVGAGAAVAWFAGARLEVSTWRP